MSDDRIVIVTGATGWIGSNVCAKLKKYGCWVIACDLNRGDGPWDDFIEFDIGVEGALPNKIPATDSPSGMSGRTLIHCAGYAHRPNETAEQVQRFFAINAEGTRRVVQWAKSIGVERLLYLSSIAFYDWNRLTNDLPLDETARLFAQTAYAESKLEGEKHVMQSGLDNRVVRLATVFGKGDPANFYKLAGALKRRRFILPGKGLARKSVISVELASELIARYALMDNPAHRLINLGFNHAPTLNDICRAYAEVCGFPKPVSVPAQLLFAMAKIGDALSRIVPGFPLTSINIDKLTKSTWVNCSKSAELFPELRQISFAEALRDSAGFYREI